LSPTKFQNDEESHIVKPIATKGLPNRQLLAKKMTKPTQIHPNLTIKVFA